MEILLQNFKKVQGHCSCESARTSSVVTGSKTQDIQETLLETHCHKIDQSGIRCLAVCSWLFNLQCLPSVAEKDFDNAHGDFATAHVADLFVLERRARTIAMDEDE